MWSTTRRIQRDYCYAFDGFSTWLIVVVLLLLVPVVTATASFGLLSWQSGFGQFRFSRSSSSSSRNLPKSRVADTTTCILHAGGGGQARSSTSNGRCSTSSRSGHEDADNIANDDPNSLLLPLWKLATAHCASQALRVLLQLRIPDTLGNGSCSVQEIAMAIQKQQLQSSSSSSSSSSSQTDHDHQQQLTNDLLRILRVLTTVDILNETLETDDNNANTGKQKTIFFSLTPTGRSLQSNADTANNGGTSGRNSSFGLAAGIQHWMEAPLWNSWLHIPPYLQDGSRTPLPFERANGGISSDDYYNERDHPESLQLANDFVRWIHHQEVQAVVHGVDWLSIIQEKNAANETGTGTSRHGHCRPKLVDIGGHYGALASAIAAAQPHLDCYSFDLPHVIEKASPLPPSLPPTMSHNVQLIAGNILDPSTLPSDCDVVLMKHFLDRCMWNETQTIQILQSCHAALSSSSSGILIIAEAVLPDIGTVHKSQNGAAAGAAAASASLVLSMDAMYMMVGREGQRTLQEWKDLAHASGFVIDKVQHTSVPSCSILLLRKK